MKRYTPAILHADDAMLPISFEFYPPKTDEQRAQLDRSVQRLKAHKPQFMSVTFGAGGSTLSHTPETVQRLRSEHDVAGVPHITAGMLDALTGMLEGGRPVVSKTIGCWVAESEVADLLRNAEKAHDGVSIGSYPFFRDGRTGANFVVRSPDAALVDTCIAALAAALEATGREVAVGGI